MKLWEQYLKAKARAERVDKMISRTIEPRRVLVYA